MGLRGRKCVCFVRGGSLILEAKTLAFGSERESEGGEVLDYAKI